MSAPGDDYLGLCKILYGSGIYPSAQDERSKEGLKRLRSVAVRCITVHGSKGFAGFLQEYHYLVDLHTAHFLLEQKPMDRALEAKCLDVIELYARSPLNALLAEQERNWLARRRKSS